MPAVRLGKQGGTMEVDPFVFIRDTIMEGAEEIGSKFTEPDDDWFPAIFLAHGFEAGSRKIEVVDIRALMRNAETKQFLAEVIIPSAIETFHVHTFGFVSSAWITVVDTTASDHAEHMKQLNRKGVRSDPGRQEVVVMEIIDRLRCEDWIAPIERYPDAPPTLGEWKRQEHSESRWAPYVRRAMSPQG